MKSFEDKIYFKREFSMCILKVFSGHWTAAGFYDFYMPLILISEWVS